MERVPECRATPFAAPCIHPFRLRCTTLALLGVSTFLALACSFEKPSPPATVVPKPTAVEASHPYADMIRDRLRIAQAIIRGSVNPGFYNPADFEGESGKYSLENPNLVGKLRADTFPNDAGRGFGRPSERLELIQERGGRRVSGIPDLHAQIHFLKGTSEQLGFWLEVNNLTEGRLPQDAVAKDERGRPVIKLAWFDKVARMVFKYLPAPLKELEKPPFGAQSARAAFVDQDRQKKSVLVLIDGSAELEDLTNKLARRTD